MSAGSEDIDGLGIQEVARQLGVHEQTLRRWIWRGKVQATRSQVGRTYRWLVTTDGGAMAAVDRPAVVGTLEADLQSDDLDSPAATPRAGITQRERLSAIEEQIEKEIRRLTAESAALQAEIGRLTHTLGVLRSEQDP